jgi:hypothetical protein
MTDTSQKDVPADQPEPWPFAPGDVVRDSGEDGDDAAWLDAAPVGVHVIDRHSNPWRRFPKGWASPKATGDGSGAPSDYLASRGPITVTSLSAARPAAPTAPATPGAGVGTSAPVSGPQIGAGELGLGDAIRAIPGLAMSGEGGTMDALMKCADRADVLEQERAEALERLGYVRALAMVMTDECKPMGSVHRTDLLTLLDEPIADLRAADDEAWNAQ